MIFRGVIFVFVLISASFGIGRGSKRSQILEQEMNGLKENLTMLWELIGQMQMQIERLEQEPERVHHHHHHYHHRYFIVADNETLEDMNGTLSNDSIAHEMLLEHETTFERELLPNKGEHHQHHHHVHHHHARNEINHNPEPELNGYSRCNGNGNGNGNGHINGNLEEDDSEEVLAKAVCHVRPNRALPSTERQNVRGTVHFRQKLNHLVLIIHLRGFLTTPEHAHPDYHDQSNTRVHGLHVHEFGDLSNGCESAGGHYNPLGDQHGGRQSNKRHVGDFGNIECDQNGKLEFRKIDNTASLTGTYSIIGKTLVIHENPDDSGVNLDDNESVSNGNAGRRLACCVITKQGD